MPSVVEANGLLARLETPMQQALVAAVGVAGAARLWLVGGVVRDLLLGHAPGRDLDLVLDGVATEHFAPALARALGGQVLAQHGAFGTATIVAGVPPLVIDVVRARSEHYPHPASLPEVRPAALADDLLRRDFTINTLALPLGLADGELASAPLIDHHGGLQDLRAGLLRVLHPASFRDDPTRMLRGLRLAARLGLRLEPASALLRDDALARGYLGLLTPERVRNELCLALEEPRPDAVLRLSDGWGVSAALLPELRWSTALEQRCALFATAHADVAAFDLQPAAIYAGLLAYGLPAAAREHLVERYRLPGGVGGLLRDIGRAQVVLPQLGPASPASLLDRQLRGINVGALVVVHYAEPPPTRDLIARYLHQIRPVATMLDGADLQGLGMQPGPSLGRMLAELRAAQLDGQVTTSDEARAWVQARL